MSNLEFHKRAKIIGVLVLSVLNVSELRNNACTRKTSF